MNRAFFALFTAFLSSRPVKNISFAKHRQNEQEKVRSGGVFLNNSTTIQLHFGYASRFTIILKHYHRKIVSATQKQGTLKRNGTFLVEANRVWE